MRYLLLAISLSVLLSACKLMKKDDEKETKSKKSMTTAFNAPGWAHSTNIYEVNIRQYSPEGTFNAFGNE